MIANGWPDEVERLAREVDDAAPAWKASGYLAMRAMISGRISLAAARERVLVETRQYAKRQRTWFRHQLDKTVTTRIDPNDAAADEVARTWWGERGTE
jgi:tRNA dimethylallyltransferase